MICKMPSYRFESTNAIPESVRQPTLLLDTDKLYIVQRMGRNNFKVLQAIPQPKNTRWQMQTLAVERTEIQTETRWMANAKYEHSNRKLSSNCFCQSPQSWIHPFCA